MRSSTARKIEIHTESVQTGAQIFDFQPARNHQAVQQEPMEAGDFEAFMQHYGMKLNGHFE